MQAGEGARDMEADQSLWPPLHRRGRIPRLLQAPQNAACVLVECGARLGEMRAARGAMKQADTKILFKAGDRARDGRCLGIRGNCSFRKAADLYRSHKHTQRGQIVHFWRLRIALATKRRTLARSALCRDLRYSGERKARPFCASTGTATRGMAHPRPFRFLRSGSEGQRWERSYCD